MSPILFKGGLQTSLPSSFQEDVGALSYLTSHLGANVWGEYLSHVIRDVRTLGYALSFPGCNMVELLG